MACQHKIIVIWPGNGARIVFEVLATRFMKVYQLIGGFFPLSKAAIVMSTHDSCHGMPTDMSANIGVLKIGGNSKLVLWMVHFENFIMRSNAKENYLILLVKKSEILTNYKRVAHFVALVAAVCLFRQKEMALQSLFM